MRFHVLGIGSIGTLVAHHLRRTLPSTEQLSLIVRKDRNGFIPKDPPSSIIVEQDGVRSYVRGGFDTEWAESSQEAASRLIQMLKEEQTYGREKVDKLQRLSDGLAMSPLGKHIDVLIVTTKANKTLQAIRQCRERLSRNSTVVLLQNGMGTYETVVEHLFPLAEERPNFILATTTHGAWKKRDIANAHHVVHAGKGELHFGIVPDPLSTRQRDFERSFWNVPSDTPVSERMLSLGDIEDAETASSPASAVLQDSSRYISLRRTVAALLALDLETRWQPMSQLQIRLRQKVTINSSVNPLTALLGCRNGDLLGSTHARSLVRSVCHEAADVFRRQTVAQGGEGTDEWMFGGGQASPGGMQALSAGVLESETERVIKATSPNYSSMLLDMERGSVLEVDFMNGYLSRLGQAYKVPTPTIDALRNAVLIKASLRRVSQGV